MLAQRNATAAAGGNLILCLDTISYTKPYSPPFSCTRFDIVANNGDALMGLSKALVEVVNMAKKQEKTANVSEARTHRYELLKMAETGAEITITKHGTSLVKLMPLANPAPRSDPKSHDSAV
jgi:prevent-host-death family protein